MNKDLKKMNERLLYNLKFCKGETKSGNNNHIYMKNIPSAEEIESCKSNSVILAKDIYMSLDSKFTMRNLNTFVLGSAGTGKTRHIIEPNILQANTSFVVNDTQGMLISKYGDFLISKGYKIRYVNLIDMDKTMKYNPFKYIKCEDDITEMAECIIKNIGESSSDPFWSSSEKTLLEAIIGYLYESKTEETQTLYQVKRLLEMFDLTKDNPFEEMDILFKYLKVDNENSFAYKKYMIFKMTAGNKKTFGIILTSLAHRLSIFEKKEIRELTSSDELDLENLGQEKTALFIINSCIDLTYNVIASLLMSQAMNVLEKPFIDAIKANTYPICENKIHTKFILDDFSNIGSIPKIVNKFIYSKNCNISSTIIISCLAQMKYFYNEKLGDIPEWKAIIEKCDTLIFTGSINLEDEKYIEETLGKRTFDKLVDTKFLGRKTKKMIKVQFDRKNWCCGECFIIIRGFKPFMTKMFNLSEHPNYKYCSEVTKKYYNI